MVKVLELFSGTRSVGKCCDQLGWESVSVDMILPADHKCDIMDFNYKQYDKNEFDIIWGSPPCTEYSKAKTNYDKNGIVRKLTKVLNDERWKEEAPYVILKVNPNIILEEEITTDILCPALEEEKVNNQYVKASIVDSSISFADMIKKN